uniref:Ribosomal protein/NADH dehydrogenase domain-containing protein n=1 Tax=Araucaria cunninghamii TaxID=56994 RepID=A0A0D6R4M3_ARACU
MAWRAQLSRNLKELRIHLCQVSPSSAATRDFIRSNYKDLKTLNPKFPILIRECSGIEPRIWARYQYGIEKSVALDGLTEGQITKKVEELVKDGVNISASTAS